jgi:hypothetical protein
MITLKTIEQVEISDAFKHQARDYFGEIVSRAEKYNRRTTEAFIKTLGFWLTCGGFEMFLTRMKQLPYNKFDAIRSDGQVYFKATTKPLIVEISRINRHHGWAGNYDIGAYSIYIPYRGMLNSNIEDIHFIPEKNKWLEGYDRWELEDRGSISHYRHLHHYAYFSHRESKISNPLTYNPRTCWGNFGSMVSSIMGDGDLPELFRTLYLYVTIQNPDSPLVQLVDLDHYKRIDND